jgi:hypothetical protein
MAQSSSSHGSTPMNLAELDLVAVIEPRLLERLEHLLRSHREHTGAAATGDVSQGVGEKRFADADRSDDRDMGVAVEKPQRRQFIQERAVTRDLGAGIPRFQMHRGIKGGSLHAQRDRQAVARVASSLR